MISALQQNQPVRRLQRNFAVRQYVTLTARPGL